MANVASGLPFLSGCLLTWFSSPSSMCDAGPLLLPASSVSECSSPQHPPRGPSPLWLATVAAEGPSRLLLPAGLKNYLPQVSRLWAAAPLTGDFHQEFAGKYYSALVPPPPSRPLVHPYTSRSCMCEPICSRLPEQESLGPGTSLLTKLPPSLGGFITYPSTPRRRDRSPRPLEVP